MQQPIIPKYPQIRPVEPHWIEHEGQKYLYLRDPLNLSDMTLLLPHRIAPIINFIDGKRKLVEIKIALQLHTGITVTEDDIETIVSQLDKALMIQNGSYVDEMNKRLNVYRTAKFRPPSHAGLVYPERPIDLVAKITKYTNFAESLTKTRTNNRDLVGMLCPHIDYNRGHKTYATLWEAAKSNLSDIELIIIFGTDHLGSAGKITLTKQSYATPYGTLATDIEIVDKLSAAIGHDNAFGEELHHINEHSIELAAVWLHHYIRDQPITMVPILCGSYHHFTERKADPDNDHNIAATLDILKEFMTMKRTLVISAGDLAHVGPAFGDETPLDINSRKQLHTEDQRTIDALLNGDASGLLEISTNESDARRICGLPPTYLMLKLINNCTGDAFGYDQCPADEFNGSTVSIVGALLYDE